MRDRVLGECKRRLLLGAAIFLIGGLAAGCSSNTARFDDSIFTGSTPNQREIIGPALNQPYPGDVASSASAEQAASNSRYRPSVDGNSVGHSDLGPVTASSLPPADGTGRAAAPPHSTRVASLPAPSRMETAQPLPLPDRPPVGDSDDGRQDRLSRSASRDRGPGGWSRVGGTVITTVDGDTVYDMSRRFGVPVKAILQANGMASASALRAGQRVVIPTYTYSRNAKVSVVDDKERREATPERGSHDARVRTPEHVAVLPQPPRIRDHEVGRQVASLDAHAAIPAEHPEPSPRMHEAETSHQAHETASAAPQAGGNYTVQSGDSLYAIAKKTGVRVEQIKEANHLSSGILRIGQTLAIPNGARTALARKEIASANPASVDSVKTDAGGPAKATPDGGASNRHLGSYTPPAKDDKKIAAINHNSANVAAPDSTGIGKMRWPVRGRVISTYGSSTVNGTNDGINIAVPEGTPVKAAENGVVIYAGNGLKEFGNTVLIRHEDGLVTVYGNASKLEVSRGEKVRRGQEIALSGMTGSVTTPQLHFEVRKNSAPVNPGTYLE